MRQVAEFAKLFKVKIPVEADHLYYIGKLLGSEEYSSLREQIRAFEALEFELECRNQTFKEYARGVFNSVKDRLASTSAYRRFSAASTNGLLKPEMKGFQPKGCKYVSVDIRTANWAILKSFDAEKELPQNWVEFCREYDYAHSLSKSFRQIVFGNLNPSKFTRMQEHCTALALGYLKGHVAVSAVFADEVIVEGTLYQLHGLLPESLDEASEWSAVQFKCTEFTQQEIEKGRYVRHVTEQSGRNYKTLVGVPGNMYHMYYKAFILEEPITHKDKLFVQDGLVAAWVDLPESVRRQEEGRRSE